MQKSLKKTAKRTKMMKMVKRSLRTKKKAMKPRPVQAPKMMMVPKPSKTTSPLAPTRLAPAMPKTTLTKKPKKRRRKRIHPTSN